MNVGNGSEVWNCFTPSQEQTFLLCSFSQITFSQSVEDLHTHSLSLANWKLTCGVFASKHMIYKAWMSCTVIITFSLLKWNSPWRNGGWRRDWIHNYFFSSSFSEIRFRTYARDPRYLSIGPTVSLQWSPAFPWPRQHPTCWTPLSLYSTPEMLMSSGRRGDNSLEVSWY